MRAYWRVTRTLHAKFFRLGTRECVIGPKETVRVGRQSTHQVLCSQTAIDGGPRRLTSTVRHHLSGRSPRSGRSHKHFRRCSLGKTCKGAAQPRVCERRTRGGPALSFALGLLWPNLMNIAKVLLVTRSPVPATSGDECELGPPLRRSPEMAHRVISLRPEFGRYRGIADSATPPTRQIYGLTASSRVASASASASPARSPWRPSC